MVTREEAVSTGWGMVTRFSKAFVVYRLPAWPPEVFGLVALDRGLPPQAEIVERLNVPGTAAPTDTTQGELF